MRIKHLLLFSLCLGLCLQISYAQGKYFPSEEEKALIRSAPAAPMPTLNQSPLRQLPQAKAPFAGMTNQYARQLSRPFPFLGAQPQPVDMLQDPKTGLPVMISGELKYTLQKFPGKSEMENQLFSYLSLLKGVMGMQQPEKEFAVTSVSEDALGHTHVRLQQLYKGVEVYGGELQLHLKDAAVHFFNGRYYPTPSLARTTPAVGREAAVRLVEEDLAQHMPVRKWETADLKYIDGKPVEASLVVYHPYGELEGERLAWAVNIAPNLTQRWAYFVDALDGSVLEHYSLLCQLHPRLERKEGEKSTHHATRHKGDKEKIGPLPADGPRTANAGDLLGQTRTINTYEYQGAFFLIDASRDMFNLSQSTLPNDPKGAIWTIDAQNGNPQDENFEVSHVVSGNNNWSDPNAVSAHYNAGRAYEYFRNTFNRNSINGRGGTVISIINVTDENGRQMDNAFWNGAAMFYGNGDEAFTAPLAKSLDVAGHEMSHGVIQNTANLEYYGESGALNESFADIFGVLIDRDDWQLGEEVVNRNIFHTGALRDMGDPNNGGARLGDPGWQPASTTEQYFGQQDNAGVHINSGIPNRAFYLFANQVGREVAEQVYYRALDVYLVRSSQFVDMRVATLQSARDLYGENVAAAAAAAFDAVGIFGDQGGDYQEDLESNPGQSLIVYADPDFQTLTIATPDGSLVADPLFNEGVISRPSVTDDGSVIVFVGEDRHIHFFVIDWENLEIVNSGILSNTPEWRNVAISRDGSKLAGVVGSFDDPGSLDNRIYIFDLTSDPITADFFELYNPTTAQDGAQTGDVFFADRLEWDFSGEFVLYDAFNSISSAFEGSIDYWDIGFLQAWDNASQNFSGGTVFKLFNGLQEGITVGNASFAKNSPYIIAFDYTEDNESFDQLGVNIETGDIGIIFEGNPVPGVPNFSSDDQFLIFDATTQGGDRVLAFSELEDSKITGAGDASLLFSDATTGVWFATGSRTLSTSTPTLLYGRPVEVFPNPFDEQLTVNFELPAAQTVFIELFDAMGRRVYGEQLQGAAGAMQHRINAPQLPAGAYVLRLSTGGESVSRQVLRGR